MVQYHAAVLFSWFLRVATLLDCKIKDHDMSMIMSVLPLVSDANLPCATWDWVKKKEIDFMVKGRDGEVDAGCKHAFSLIKSYLAVTPRPLNPTQPQPAETADTSNGGDKPDKRSGGNSDSG